MPDITITPQTTLVTVNTQTTQLTVSQTGTQGPPGPSGVNALSLMSDVTITGPTNNQFLKYNAMLFSKSIAYSDSISDLPLLQWADEGVVVSRHKSQAWAKTYGFTEIVHD